MVTIISRKSRQENTVILYARVVVGKKDNAIALGISLDVSRWNYINETLKTAKKSQKRGTSIFIDDSLASKLWEILRGLMIEEKAGTLTSNSAALIISKVLHKEEIELLEKRKEEQLQIEKATKELDKPTLMAFINQYIDDCDSGVRLKRRSTKKIAHSTVKGYMTFRNVLKDYQDSRKRVVDWSDVTLDLYFDLKNYYIERGFSPNTIARHMRTFKIMLNAAKESHLTLNDDFQSSRFSVDWEDVDNIYIPTERIKEMYEIDLMDLQGLNKRIEDIDNVDEATLKELKEFIATESHRRMLDNARDIFLAGCMVGQRISDYSRLEQGMIEVVQGENFVHLMQKKTGKEVYIPVLNYLSDILDKHHGKLPHIKDAKLNARIKLVGLLLGWTEMANINKQKGVLSFKSNKRFYECITTHTARRSFATNAYQAGVPLSAIMTITGHSTEAMLRKYLKLDNKEKAVLAAAEFKKIKIAL